MHHIDDAIAHVYDNAPPVADVRAHKSGSVDFDENVRSTFDDVIYEAWFEHPTDAAAREARYRDALGWAFPMDHNVLQAADEYVYGTDAAIASALKRRVWRL